MVLTNLPDNLMELSNDIAPAFELTVEHDIQKPLTMVEKLEEAINNTSNVEDLPPITLYSGMEREDIENLTTDQSQANLWHRYRQGVITGTKIHGIITRMRKIDKGSVSDVSDSLIEKVLGMSDNTFKGSIATEYGKENEENAFQQYNILLQKQNHINLKLAKRGLVLSAKSSYMGASPDGLRTCDCCGKVLMEIKCPYSARSKGPSEFSKALPYFKTQDDLVSINHNHPYFSQIQWTMGILEVDSCDFIVWSKKGMKVLNVKYDKQFFQDAMDKSVAFYNNYFIPYIYKEWKV